VAVDVGGRPAESGEILLQNPLRIALQALFGLHVDADGALDGREDRSPLRLEEDFFSGCQIIENLFAETVNLLFLEMHA